MAENGKGKAAPERKTKMPVYTTVLVTRGDKIIKPDAKGHVELKPGDKLEIVEPTVQAPTQEKACDSVAESKSMNGMIGAFLATSFRAWPYTTKTKPVTEKLSIEELAKQQS